MKKIYNIFERTRNEQTCPKCESSKISIGVDLQAGYWCAYCEACGERGPKRDLLDWEQEF